MKPLDKEIALVRKVFNTPDGRELLQLWTQYHIYSGVQHENAMILANRVGKLEFVTTITNTLLGD
jgi:hypothetical protein